MYIHSHAGFVGRPIDDLQYYKKEVSRFTTLHFRRANRFVLLALAGASRCAYAQGVKKDTAVYLTTENGNLGDTESVLHQIFHKHEFPMPYNFINTMSNTASFYVAQSLELLGRNITFSCKQLSFERGLELLRADLSAGVVQEALIGGVDEAVFSKTQFETKYGLPYDAYPMVEGSCWFLIKAEQADALGRIQYLATPGNFGQTKAWLEQHPLAGPLVLACGLLVTPMEKERLRQVLPNAMALDYFKEVGYFDSAGAGCLCAFLEKYTAATLVHVNKDFRGWFTVLIVEKY